MSQKISDSTIKRLTLYYNLLVTITGGKDEVISSKNLAHLVGVTDAQVRKDLTYFGSFGKRGQGYNIKNLCRHLSKILGIKSVEKIALIGIGNLGKALISYRGFHKYGYEISCLFDSDPRKIGKNIKGYNCFDISKLKSVLRKKNINMAIIAVPKDKAQHVAEELIACSVRAILNFAPCKIIHDSSKVKVINVDMASELKALSYFLSLNK